ncbi:hypothetical protein MTO96_024200 [Rhipicephalus appendiculatus]
MSFTCLRGSVSASKRVRHARGVERSLVALHGAGCVPTEVPVLAKACCAFLTFEKMSQQSQMASGYSAIGSSAFGTSGMSGMSGIQAPEPDQSSALTTCCMVAVMLMFLALAVAVGYAVFGQQAQDADDNLGNIDFGSSGGRRRRRRRRIASTASTTTK